MEQSGRGAMVLTRSGDIVRRCGDTTIEMPEVELILAPAEPYDGVTFPRALDKRWSSLMTAG